MADLEALTHDYGRAIFARLDTGRPLPFGPSWWDERLMAWTMSDEALKVQLFRFVDVLPLLRSPADITQHLRQYIGLADSNLSAWLRWGVHRLPQRGLAGRLLAATAYKSAER